MSDKGWPGYGDNRYAEQREAGFPWLSFSPEIELEYRNAYIESNALRMRVSAAVALFGALGFLIVDQVLGKNLMPQSAQLLVLFVTIPALMAPLIATFRTRAGAGTLHVVLAGTIVATQAAVAALTLSRLAHPEFLNDGVYLLVMYVYFLSGMLFYQAVACGLALALTFIATVALETRDTLSYEVFYILMANGLGALGLYFLQWQARQGFLLRNELRQQAVLDSLTGLMNRRAFTAHLNAAWLQAQRALTSIGLMVVDLDQFKRINDTCGHPFGDHALRHVAQVLRSSALRPLDAAARYGGDEFIAIWYEVDGAWLARLAHELPARLAGLSCGDKAAPLNVTVSGGMVLAWPRPGLTVNDAIKLADELMYETKRSTPGVVGYKVLRPVSPTQERTAA